MVLRIGWFLSLLALLILPLRAADLNVFAAASLSDALKELAPAYEAGSGDKLRFNLGASSLLARQIKEGAPADVFFSADEAKMDDLAKAGLITLETRQTLLSNTLVIIVHAQDRAAVNSPADLATDAVRRLALAETLTVPAGIYAREYLRRAGLWDKVQGKVVLLENVRACLSVVESGNVDAGIVYKTDALISKKVRIAYEVAFADGPKIAYPLAVTKETKHPEAARRLAAFLASNEARAVFAKYGFLPGAK
jgi:molybdate transport system substrate-binding protein